MYLCKSSNPLKEYSDSLLCISSTVDRLGKAMCAHVGFYQRRAPLENKGGTSFTPSEALSITPKCALSKWWTDCIWILIKRGVPETSIVSNAKNNKKNILPKSFRVACVFRELLRRKTGETGLTAPESLVLLFRY